jgi:hypothetical protein
MYLFINIMWLYVNLRVLNMTYFFCTFTKLYFCLVSQVDIFVNLTCIIRDAIRIKNLVDFFMLRAPGVCNKKCGSLPDSRYLLLCPPSVVHSFVCNMQLSASQAETCRRNDLCWQQCMILEYFQLSWLSQETYAVRLDGKFETHRCLWHSNILFVLSIMSLISFIGIIYMVGLFKGYLFAMWTHIWCSEKISQSR